MTGIFSLNPITGRLDEIGNNGGGGGTGDAFTAIVYQRFISQGDFEYVPTIGMRYARAYVCAPGAGGAGVEPGGFGVGGGGGGGGFVMSEFMADEITAPVPISIGAPGLGGSPGQPGQNGGNTIFGASGEFGVASGGNGGAVGSTANLLVMGGNGGAGSSVNEVFSCNGSPGGIGMMFNSNLAGGLGGNSFMGSGANINRIVDVPDMTRNGLTPNSGYGGGGSGGACNGGPAGASGGNGRIGCIIVVEFLITV